MALWQPGRGARLGNAIWPAGAACRIDAAHFNAGTGLYTDLSGNGNDVPSPSIPILNATSDGFAGKPRTHYNTGPWSKLPVLTIPQPFHIALMGRIVTWDGSSPARLFDTTVNNAALAAFANGTSQIGLFDHAHAAYICNNGSAQINVPALIECEYNGASSYVRINGGPKIMGSIGTVGIVGQVTIAASFAGTVPADIELAALGLWPRAFTAADDTQIINVAAAEYGIFRQWIYSLSAGVDSLTTGNGVPAVSQCWPGQLVSMLGPQWNLAKNEGIAGQTLAGASISWAGGNTGNNNNGDRSFDGSFRAFVLGVNGGHNDLVTDNVDEATLISRATSFNAGRQAAAAAAGFTADIVQFGIPDSLAFSAGQLAIKNAFNAYIQTPAGQSALGIVGAIVNNTLCADGAANNLTLFQGDGTHLTLAGQIEQANGAKPFFANRYSA